MSFRVLIKRISETGETTRESSEYTWNGNVLSSTVRTHQSVDGTTRSLRYDYEYTTSGDRLQTITISQVSESGNSILTVRVTTDSYYEIEYLD